LISFIAFPAEIQHCVGWEDWLIEFCNHGWSWASCLPELLLLQRLHRRQ